MNDSSDFLKFAIDIAKEAGKIQLSYFGNYGKLSKKTTNIDLVTKADIESENFRPSPKVKSSLLIFEPKKKYLNLKCSNLEHITNVFFNQRRKMIKNPLKQIFKRPHTVLKKLKLNINLRPQNLSPLNYFEITKEYENLTN